MENELINDGGFKYIEKGEGKPIIILHGLMGGLSNFEGVNTYFPPKGYKVLIPELPLYSMPMLKTTVKNFAKYLKKFIDYKELDDVILLGNSLGGNIGLLHTKLYPAKVKALVITGSSGLYESAMGDGYPKRGDYEFIKKKAQDVFYDPAVATKEIVDEVFATVNDRVKLVKTLAIAKSAIRHNMAQDLPKIVPPSPEAASLGKFTEVPISHYTGLPNISIPIASYAVGGKSFPVGISYHARGVQVS
jgi:pimeloyl-ACP methyl ester carboxylesterase